MMLVPASREIIASSDAQALRYSTARRERRRLMRVSLVGRKQPPAY